MKSILPIALIAACLAGCVKPMAMDETVTPVATSAVTGYSSDNGFITLLNGQTPVTSLSLPNDADRKYVAKLTELIRNDVIAFIGQSKTEFTIVAARPYGRILLLDVEPKGKDDGNLYIVYDLKQGIVVGRFNWYAQG